MDEEMTIEELELETPEAETLIVEKEVEEMAGEKIKMSPAEKEARYQEHLKRVKGPAKVGDWPKK